MAKAKRNTKGATTDKPSELLQIAVLTLAMTGGGFLVLFLVLSVILVPSVKGDVEQAKKDNLLLATQLSSPQAKALRREARLREEAKSQKRSLDEIVSEQLKLHAVEEDRRAGTRDQNGLALTTRPGALRQLLSFVTAVREAKKTIQVQSIKLRRASRSRGQSSMEDAWTVDVVFIDYQGK